MLPAIPASQHRHFSFEKSTLPKRWHIPPLSCVRPFPAQSSRVHRPMLQQHQIPSTPCLLRKIQCSLRWPMAWWRSLNRSSYQRQSRHQTKVWSLSSNLISFLLLHRPSGLSLDLPDVLWLQRSYIDCFYHCLAFQTAVAPVHCQVKDLDHRCSGL